MTEPDNTSGFICGYIFDGEGGARTITLDEADSWQPEDGFLWAHFDWDSQQAASWIGANVEQPEIVESLLAGDTRPRAVPYDDHLLVILRGVNLNPESDPEDMVSLRTWIGPNRAITTRHRQIMAMTDMRERLAAGTGPTGPGDFLAFIADRLVERMIPTLTSLSDSVDDLEDVILDGDTEATALHGSRVEYRTRLAHVRRQAIALRRYLAPQREAINRLHVEAQPWLKPDHKVLLREASDHVTRYVEDLDAIRDRGAVIQDELRNSLSEDMNRTMYVLTVVAAILLPLSFITGLLGINVDGMPGAKDMPLAFWGVVILLAVFAVGQVWLFKRLKWL